MTIYITDTTLPTPKTVLFNEYRKAVTYLEGMAQRAFGKTRKDYMLLLESMGYGYDDRDSVTFVRAMSERFNIGLVRDDRTIRCDITTAAVFDKPEYGS